MTLIVIDGVIPAAVNEARALDARTAGRSGNSCAQTPDSPRETRHPASTRRALGNRVFLQTDHAHLLALDRLTDGFSGTSRWRTIV
jgi:hypothetical protein